MNVATPIPSDQHNWASFRARFPACASFGYFDIARKAILPLDVREAMEHWLDDVDTSGGKRAFSLDSVEAARSALADTYGAKKEGLAFVKNTSEGINLIARGYERLKAGDNVLVSSEEHQSNLFPWLRLKAAGVEVRIVPADPEGRLSVDHFRALADQRTRAIAVSWVTYGRGLRLDIPLLGQFARERDILLVVDAIQGLGILSDRIDSLGAQVVVSGAHKAMFGLNGTGILYVAPERIGEIDPLCVGKNVYASDERFQASPRLRDDARRFESGNLNYLGIAVLAASAGLVAATGLKAIEERIAKLTGHFLESAKRVGLSIRSPDAFGERAAILSFATSGDASTIVAGLRKCGFVMSDKDGQVRASVHAFNTEVEITDAVAAMRQAGLARR